MLIKLVWKLAEESASHDQLLHVCLQKHTHTFTLGAELSMLEVWMLISLYHDGKWATRLLAAVMIA